MTPAILVDGIRKSFGEVKALTGVSFEVPVGTVLGLLGPNGAGKTTAVRVLTTVLKPDDGRASVAGYDVVAQPQAVRRRIGLAGQYAAVDENLTGRENLTLIGRLNHLGKSAAAERAVRLLDRFKLSDAADRPARTYSGGMRRRLDLGAALVNEPPVLLLDEPTTGLDPASRLDLWEVIAGLVEQGTSVLLTTQYLEEANRLADSIVVIDKGTVVAQGTAQELKRRVGDTALVLSFADHDVARRASELIALHSPSQHEATVSIAMKGGGRQLREVLNVLHDAGVDPPRLDIREPTLDDVFLALTGGAR